MGLPPAWHLGSKHQGLFPPNVTKKNVILDNHIILSHNNCSTKFNTGPVPMEFE